MSMYNKKVTPLQEYHTDGVSLNAKDDTEIPQSPPAIEVANERQETYSLFKDWSKIFKKGE